ncbi:(d)CMP kinase [Bellilinea sp.]|uniref:(d)CMP kinase n=1 Tax=Bellilinea sp. TaxID=2838785 RepID=UPI002ADDDDBF|nr:(d)CMP kinase [Bellilinea sp.]
MTIPNSIAIDGPASSGKSTIGVRLAERLGYLFFDTGIMYRAVTLAVIRKGIDINDEDEVTRLAQIVHIDVRSPSIADGRKEDVLLDGEDVTWAIRDPEVEKWVSKISAYAGVRRAMTQLQRRIGKRGRVVMVGRDIGTVVMPDADLKIYLDASLEERARRRYQELVQRGESVTLKEVLVGLKKRDQIDSSREIAPLKPAKDAVILNTDGLSIEEVLKKALELCGVVGNE